MRPSACAPRFWALVVAATWAAACTDEPGAFSVEPEPAGENCAEGGVRIDDGSGSVEYVCNGTSGTSGTNGTDGTDGTNGTSGETGSDGGDVVVSEEPPGDNCEAGGLRVEAPDGTVSYVCNGTSVAPPSVSLCPADILPNASASLGIFVSVIGETQGAIEGDATEPAPGAIRAAATCHRITTPMDPASGLPTGIRMHTAFIVVTEIDPSTVPLYNALIDLESVSVTIDYFDQDALGAAVLASQVHLGDAFLGRVEQLTAPDPANPGTFKAYQRLSFVYESYSRTTIEGGIFVQDTVAGAGYSGSTPACAPTGNGTPRMFLRVKGQLHGPILGDAVHPLATDWIEVLGACHQVYVPVDAGSGLPTGRRLHAPVAVIKPEDRASSLLLDALISNENLTEVELRYVRPGTATDDEVYFTIDLVNARVSSYEAFAQDGTRLERIAFHYQKIEWTWADGPILAEDDWETPLAFQ